MKDYKNKDSVVASFGIEINSYCPVIFNYNGIEEDHKGFGKFHNHELVSKISELSENNPSTNCIIYANKVYECVFIKEGWEMIF